MTQVARNLTDAEDGFLRGMHDLILDRDPLYTAAFRDRSSAPINERNQRGLRYTIGTCGVVSGSFVSRSRLWRRSQ